MKPPRLLVVGPGHHGRGGIAAVIAMHRQAAFWPKYHTTHLATYDDRTRFHKIRSALSSWFQAPFLIIRADLVHIHLAAQISLLRKLPIVAAARLLRKPIIIHLHAATESSLFDHTPRSALRFTFLSATRVIALSESWAAILRHHLPKARVTVIPNPILPRAPRPNPSSPVILLAGKLEPRKGYADLLNAAAIVLRDIPEAQFWFAGHGELPQARALAAQLTIEPSIRLLGWLDRPQLEAVYAQTAILTLPSYGEGVPISVIEAMSLAIPVIATPVGGIPEWIDPNRNGLLIQPGDVEAQAAAILSLLRSPTLATTLGEAGRTTVLTRCIQESVSTQLETLYTEVLKP